MKKNIIVLYGGKADEHSISCISTSGVLNALDTSRYNAIPVGITKSGEWVVGGEDPRSWSLDAAKASGQMPEVRGVSGGEGGEDGEGGADEASSARSVILDISQGADGFLAVDDETGEVESLGHIDAVFPVLHGPFGEDGTVQGLLEMMGVPYVGCGVLASAACMDKHYTKELLREAGIPVAAGITIDARVEQQRSGEWLAARVAEAGLELPLFVKPSRAGSSFGVTRVDEVSADGAALEAAVAVAAEHDWRVLIEQGVNAREIECAVLAPRAGGEVRASLPGEVVIDSAGSGDFYDFDSKYMDESASHVEVPAALPDELLEKVRDVAVRAFRAVDGAGLSRVDTFVTASGEVLVNEINTMPGFTPISMYSKAWEATGLSYSDLITELIEGVTE
ncbi:D-alanine--D-alanine ligase A [Alloscardovia macacae]|uniref:D-alanine--D-alanine ligase n=1 Tax=Alloscardovia macacae TaxID=1160091 RepID=A0A1Y2T1J6_9BIFI|nr:D-alanine--D-alanine ligase family protein [Alloscardovia macacae]OTA29856.1 D-alanine--D-alanine ligase A [Alloscardovia macacae]